MIRLALDPSLSYRPRRVVSIVCSSRSGSTVFKYALCLHPHLSTLAGEEEPYYKLANNGYPWHASDEFHQANNPELVRLLIANELHNHESARNRRLLQENHVEEPPFVEPIECRRTDTLVLKTPQNCYRRGVLEQLYPEAEIVYLAMRRDPRAVINGLLDGWASGQFTARHTDRGWWCFDMPPNWSWDAPLLERCINQWRASQDFIARDYPDLRADIAFEDFEDDWFGVCGKAWDLLGLPPYEAPIGTVLPELAITDQPHKERWKAKRPWLAELAV